jgi:hypothetical protein
MTQHNLMSVRTEVVEEVLIPSLLEAALEREDRPLPEQAEAALARMEDPLSVRLARLGYLAREVELERFAPARQRMPWLANHDPAELAAEEPLEKPRPDDQRAATWRVPGPGGHVRHLLAMRAAAHVAREGDGAADARELKRAWVYGFLLHCREEAAS